MENRDELQNSLSTVIIRTTRDEVKSYIEFTDRIPKTHILEATPEEKELYSSTTEFVRDLWGHGGGSAILPLMMLQRQLSSSTSATIPALRRKMTGRSEDKAAIEELIDMAEKIKIDSNKILF